MDDIGSKLSGILSDPRALQQIKELGDMLGLSNTNSNGSNSGVHTNEHAENKGQEKQHDEWRENHQQNYQTNHQDNQRENHQDNSISMPLGLDMLKTPDMLSMITKFAPLLSQLNREDDTTRLLFALRPFLSQERQKKLDEAGKLIKMMKILPLVKEFGILDSLF